MEMNKPLQELRAAIDDPTQGLPEEIFLFVTEITPMVNVDLLIRDDRGRILLAWRDDEFYGKGWHVPGGIIRLKETFEERIQKTAIKEIGTEVIISPQPLEIIPLIHKEQKVRGHFITFVYECKLPEGSEIDNSGRQTEDIGYLMWHEKYPDNMIPVHEIYRKYFKE